jgi:hypothetical protein
MVSLKLHPRDDYSEAGRERYYASQAPVFSVSNVPTRLLNLMQIEWERSGMLEGVITRFFPSNKERHAKEEKERQRRDFWFNYWTDQMERHREIFRSTVINVIIAHQALHYAINYYKRIEDELQKSDDPLEQDQVREARYARRDLESFHENYLMPTEDRLLENPPPNERELRGINETLGQKLDQHGPFRRAFSAMTKGAGEVLALTAVAGYMACEKSFRSIKGVLRSDYEDQQGPEYHN